MTYRIEFSQATRQAAWKRAAGTCECGCGLEVEKPIHQICTPLPCASSLSSFLQYDPDTGLFVWGAPKRNYFRSYRAWRVWLGKWSGKDAFVTIRDGYLVGHLLGRRRLAHRVAWKLQTGKDPGIIDHADGNPLNNSFSNLRVVSSAQNSENRAIRSDNSSGVTGVQRHRDGRWRATIYTSGRRHHLGLFERFDDAVTARRAAEDRFQFLSREVQ